MVTEIIIVFVCVLCAVAAFWCRNMEENGEPAEKND